MGTADSANALPVLSSSQTWQQRGGQHTVSAEPGAISRRGCAMIERNNNNTGASKTQRVPNEYKLTLLLGLRQNTISECTFRVFNRPSTLSLHALNAAARACLFDTSYVNRSITYRFKETMIGESRAKRGGQADSQYSHPETRIQNPYFQLITVAARTLHS
jgi:hypothetical protein